MTSRYPRDPLSRRDLLLIIISGIVIVGVIVGLIVLLAGRPPQSRPATPTVLATPSPSGALGAPTASEMPSEAPTSGPTSTLEPYQYTIQKDDTLGGIVQVFGYRDTSVYPEIVRLNNLPNENILPPAGSVLLIPRQTPTVGPSPSPTPEGATGGPAVDYRGCDSSTRCVSPDGGYWMHEVVSGDTVLSIAAAYDSRRDEINRANGMTDSSFLSLGQILKIPILVTLTPTLTPTGGPDSTATPSPTASAPSLLAPLNGAKAARSPAVILQWVAVHPLEENQRYLIILKNTDTGKESRYVTRSNSYRLPDELQPGLGQSAHFEWQVVVIAGTNTNAAPIGGQDAAWTFIWGP